MWIYEYKYKTLPSCKVVCIRHLNRVRWRTVDRAFFHRQVNRSSNSFVLSNVNLILFVVKLAVIHSVEFQKQRRDSKTNAHVLRPFPQNLEQVSRILVYCFLKRIALLGNLKPYFAKPASFIVFLKFKLYTKVCIYK